MDVFEVANQYLPPLVYSISTETVMSLAYEKRLHDVINRQKTIQVQFFNKDNYKRWKNQLRKANYFFNRAVF